MSQTINLCQREDLFVEMDERSQITKIKDLELDMEILDTAGEWEFQVNGQSSSLEMTFHEDRRGLLQTRCKTRQHLGYAQGWELHLDRLIVPEHHGLNLQYRLKRQRLSQRIAVPGPNPHESEMPLWIDTLGFLGWDFKLLQKNPMMRVAHLGAAGPKEHVGLFEGPMDQVQPKLWHDMHRSYPGMLSVPGVLYYDSETQEWLCISARRSKLAYQLVYRERGLAFQVQYHAHMNLDDEFPIPEISIHWGKGFKSMEDHWSSFFNQNEKTPDWVGRSTWAMMDYHTVYSNHQLRRPGPFSFEQLGDAASSCIEAGGANAFWFYTHDIRRSDSDTSPYSMAPSPDSGTRRQFKAMVEQIREAGGRSLIWMSTAGLNPRGDLKKAWTYQGVDGRPFVSWGFDGHEFIQACNPLKPGFREYFLGWIRKYLENYEVDGFFLDCGVFGYPCDFSPEFTANHFPSEAAPAMRELYLEMLELIETIRPGQVFTFHEGVHGDMPAHGGMLCGMDPNPALGKLTAQGQMARLGQHGYKQTWSSFSPYDLQSGFVHWNPVCGGTTREELIAYANDPINKEVVKMVKEHGAHQAKYIWDGLSMLGDRLVTIPGYKASLPPEMCHFTKGKTITDWETGEIIPLQAEGQLSLPGGRIFELS